MFRWSNFSKNSINYLCNISFYFTVMNWKWLTNYLVISHSLPYNIVETVVFSTIVNNIMLDYDLFDYVKYLCQLQKWRVWLRVLYTAEHPITGESFSFGTYPRRYQFFYLTTSSTSPHRTSLTATIELGDVVFEKYGNRIAPEEFL